MNEYPDDKRLKVLAYRNEQMPDNLRPEDQLLFLSLRALYQQNAFGALDRATGEAEQAKLFAERDKRVREYELGNRLILSSAHLWRGVENSSTRYRFARISGDEKEAMAAADDMYRSIYRINVVPIDWDAGKIHSEFNERPGSSAGEKVMRYFRCELRAREETDDVLNTCLCILGYREPSLEEAEKFLFENGNMDIVFGHLHVASIKEIKKSEAFDEFNVNVISDLPVFAA